MTHAMCGRELSVVTRTVIAQPQDRNWPKDTEVKVPYCYTCGKLVVDVTEVQL